MRIAIGSDHAKEAVKVFLTAEDREVLDLGTHSTDPVDYCDYAEAVGRALRENRADGFLQQGASDTSQDFGKTPLPSSPQPVP
jgi:ribose 5-phosphate isomerase RpiB